MCDEQKTPTTDVAMDGPPQGPFNSARMKLLWAQRHLDFLFADMQAFFGERPDQSSRTEPASKADLVHSPFRFPPVVPWSLSVGDAVHNMRCALDHIAFELAVADLRLRNLSKKPSHDTGFPLLLTPNKGTFERKL